MKIQTYDLIKHCPIVKVLFDDHCNGGTNLLECEAYGRLVYEDKKKIILITWAVNDNDPMDTNWESFVILKAAIKSIKKVGK